MLPDFFSDGLSAIEKGVFIWLCKIVNCKIMIFSSRRVDGPNQKNAVFCGLVKVYFLGQMFFFVRVGRGRNTLKELDFNPDATHVLNNWTTRQLLKWAIIVPINGFLPARLYYLLVG